MLLAEELLLLAHTSKGTPTANLEMLDHTLSAAVLAELTVLGKLALDGAGLRVRDPAPTGDTELDEPLHRLATHDGPPRPFETWWLSLHTPDRRTRLLTRLIQQGVMTAETRRYLRIFKEELFPEKDPQPRESLHTRLRAALSADTDPDTGPDAHTSALIALAQACRVLPKTLSAKERRRAKEITERHPVGALVSRAFAQAARESIGKIAGGTST